MSGGGTVPDGGAFQAAGGPAWTNGKPPCTSGNPLGLGAAPEVGGAAGDGRGALLRGGGVLGSCAVTGSAGNALGRRSSASNIWTARPAFSPCSAARGCSSAVTSSLTEAGTTSAGL